MIRHRPARSRSCSYNSVSPRRHSCLTSRSRGKKKKKHSKSHSSKRDTNKSKKKHKRKRSPSPPPSPLSSSVSSDSSSSPRRSPARKKSRIASRSPSPAGVNPQSPSRTASPASHWDHLSLYTDSNDEFNSHSEDAQDLVPDNTDPVLETQSEISPEDLGFVNLVEEVFKLLPADMFPRKTEELLGGNRLMTFLILLLGLRVRRHSVIISVFLRIMMTIFIRNLRIIRT